MPNVETLKTARLILRELVEADASSYQKHFVNYEVVRYLGAQLPWPYPEDGIIHFLKNDVIPFQGKSKWFWAICLKENPNDLIGAVELLKIASPTNRGFWLGEPFWGKGYMTEAIEAINDYAFNQLGFEKLIFGNAVGNPRSARIKEKSGARLVRREKAEYVDPAFTERDIYELTKEEWLKIMANLELEKFYDLNEELLIVIESLEKKIFEKPLDLETVRKELTTKNKILALIAKSDGIICGFKVGYELSSEVFYSWIGGVDPEFRRNGAASFLMTEQHKLLKEMGYKYIRTSTKNKYREMLILNIKSGFDITGVQRKLKETDQSILLEKIL